MGTFFSRAQKMKEATWGKQMKTQTGMNLFSFEQGEFSQGPAHHSSCCKERPGQGTGLELKPREASQHYMKQAEIHLCTSLHPWESQSYWFVKPSINAPKQALGHICTARIQPHPCQPSNFMGTWKFCMFISISAKQLICQNPTLLEQGACQRLWAGQRGAHCWGWQCHGQAISTRKAEQGCVPCRSHPPIRSHSSEVEVMEEK